MQITSFTPTEKPLLFTRLVLRLTGSKD